ncbi:MFS transporter [Pseudonocardia asaccharolytica]|uniref:Sugar transporter n=1 Tax=Pseudonocardia asaccharolytica DSM 44247 = NBRC 16224 TaxID=1123024 RepID=A0A511D2L2_9PSEU|nr:MFS transporter [Pseudonocardia asaccharolytica]GEL19026.1 sugar transporter [Pseudonocardia asaccharolytica DSM 44247 = NBRC 16224]
MAAGTEVVQTRIPARMDRLPWVRWHWLIVMSLGTVWVLDGLEVTIKGAVGAQLTQSLGFSTVQVAGSASIYIFGAISGALFWGYLTDKFGRKKLFLITLGVYMVGVFATSLTGAAGLGYEYLWFAVARFITGFGIGGEYAAINSAIDELMPARVRGRISLAINGSYWLGALLAASLGYLYLTSLPSDLGWRIAFGTGALLAIGILLLRLFVPESPRWLLTHGRAEEAERVTRGIESQVEEEVDEPLPEATEEMSLRQREAVGFVEIAKTVFVLYPKRAVVGFSLMGAQAFLYNAIFFTYGLMLTTFYGIDPATVGLYLIPFAAGNFLGPLLLGPLFDNWGRRVMIPGTFILSGLLTVLVGWLFSAGLLTVVLLTAGWVVIFFFASAAASAGYLTVSETFPMEIRAMVIAFFYAIATAIGGILGPIFFGNLIATETRTNLFYGYLVGATVMIAAGIVHYFLGLATEKRSLEGIAAPLSVQEAREQEEAQRGRGPAAGHPARPDAAGAGAAGRSYRPSHGYSGLPMAMGPEGPDREIAGELEILVRALAEGGPATRSELSRRVRSRYWGPGRFRQALRAGLAEHRIVRAGRARFGAATSEQERLGTGGR